MTYTSRYIQSPPTESMSVRGSQQNAPQNLTTFNAMQYVKDPLIAYNYQRLYKRMKHKMICRDAVNMLRRAYQVKIQQQQQYMA